MLKAFGNFWQRFAEFKGRTNKRIFWLAAVAQLIVIAVLVAVCAFFSPFIYVAAVYALVCLTPSLAMCTRRLHDVNKKGSLMFVALIPVIGWIVCFVMFLKNGDEGENRFGAVDDGTVEDEAAAEPVAEQPAPDFIIPPIYRSDAEKADVHNVDDSTASTNGAPAYNPTVAPAAQEAEAPAAAEEPAFIAQPVADEQPVFVAQPAAQEPTFTAEPVFVAEPAADEQPVFVATDIAEEPAAEAEPADDTSLEKKYAQPSQPAYSAQSVSSIYDTPVYAYKPKGIEVTEVEVAFEAQPAAEPAEPQPAPSAQPQTEAPKADPAKPAFRPKGYRTKGFPYGH